MTSERVDNLSSASVTADQPGTNDAAPTSRLPSIVPLLAVGTFLMITTEYIVAGLLEPIADGLGVSIARVGLLITAFAVGMIIGSPVMALTTAKLPRRTTLVLALLIFAAGHVVAAVATSFVLVLIARVMTALACGAFWAIASAVATDAAGPANSSRALGVMMSGVGLATVAGVPLGSFAGQLLGWRGTFWALSGLAVLAAIVIGRFTPTHSGPPESTDRHASGVRDQVRAVSSTKMAVLVLATLLVTGGYMTAFSYLSPLLTTRTGLPTWAVPLIFVLFGAGALLGTNLAGRTADRRPMTTFIAAGTASLALMILLAAVSTHLIPTLMVVFALGTAGMAMPPVATGLAVQYGHRASALAAAVAVSAFNAGTAVGTWAGSTALTTRFTVLGPDLVGVVLAAAGLAVLVAIGVRRSVHQVASR